MKHFLLVFCSVALSSFLAKGQVTIQATLPSVIAPGSEITFDVKINKGAVSNFAKYQIDVPQGVTISEVNSRTGSFSFESGRGKVIWVAIPTEQEFVMTLKLTAGEVSGTGVINQKFYYLEGGGKKEVAAEPVAVSFSGEAAKPAAASAGTEAAGSGAAVAEAPAAVQEPAKVSEQIVNNSAAEEPVAKQDPPEEIKQPKEQVAAGPAAKSAAVAEDNVVYKVQIGAYGENPGKSKYQGIRDVGILKEGDFFKVMVGNFKSREEAQQRKNELLEKGFKGFVVSYQNGVRVK